LINETSTYLLQHAHNPVDWYPWGEEALDRARREDKPILLSVGYSACHWCHVMEHESFENEETAALMNDLFVCVKVDREERPDIDEIYMKAVQMLTGHGGWPMTVFLTPELKPFFAGTYFPPQERHGIPSFARVLKSVALAWTEQRDSVEGSSDEITSHLAVFEMVPDAKGELKESVIANSLNELYRVFDKEFGGFGGAPKFPHPASSLLIMQYAANRAGTNPELQKNCLEMITKTLDCMAYGGMYDQVGGGFARYAVDRTWLIPHFEKMLYDNAQLCRIYLQAYQITGRKYWAQIAEETLGFILREMTTPEGAFYSSLDADSEGEEGKYYVWTAQEIAEVLGKEDAKWVCDIYGVLDGGNFEGGTTVLHLMEPPEALARRSKLTDEQFWQKLNPLREKLLKRREKRVRPGRDEKVLLSWNSLMISAFVDGYRVLANPAYLAVAHRAADFVLNNMMKDGRLMRTWGRGQAKLQGYLDDYAFFIQALLDLGAVDFDTKWIEHALTLNKTMLQLFSDDRDGSLFYTSSEHERLISRTKTFYDTSTPSPTAIAVLNMQRLATMFDRYDLQERAEKILLLYSAFFQKVPDQFSTFLCALENHLSPPTEVVFVADADADGWQDMLLAVHSGYLPNSVIMLKDVSSGAQSLSQKSPLFENKALLEGHPAVYVCHRYTCEAPIKDLQKLKSEISKLCLHANS